MCPLADIDSKGRLLQTLLFLGRNDGSYAEEMFKHGFVKPTVYRTNQKLIALGLIELSYEPSVDGGGVKVVHNLTPKGKRIYEHLEMIDKLLR